MTIYSMTADHAASVLQIYKEGISTGNATFQTTAPSWEDWDKSHLTICRMVAIENDQVIGWAALTPVSDRCVYAGVAEVSVYVALKANGKGVGKALMQKLVEASEENGIWTLQAGIFPENTGSIKIHKSNGFREVGIREKIGKMGDHWRDTLLLERRSTKAGI